MSLLLLVGFSQAAWAEIVMKLLVVNPSETETKEFTIHSALPPEIKPEHVLDADGLTVDYDSQAGAYFLVGKVTLKPKASLSKHIVLEDVWVIAPERFNAVRQEIATVLKKLAGSQYQEQGGLIAASVERRLKAIENSQQQPFVNPEQHISLYRDNLKALQSLDTEMVSLRQLMVMAALQPSAKEAALTGMGAAGAATEGMDHDRGGLSVLTTWRIIFIVLGLLVLVSISFFLIWQRQLKLQLAKEAVSAAREQQAAGDNLLVSGNGGTPPPPTVEPKSPLAP